MASGSTPRSRKPQRGRSGFALDRQGGQVDQLGSGQSSSARSQGLLVSLRRGGQRTTFSLEARHRGDHLAPTQQSEPLTCAHLSSASSPPARLPRSCSAVGPPSPQPVGTSSSAGPTPPPPQPRSLTALAPRWP